MGGVLAKPLILNGKIFTVVIAAGREMGAVAELKVALC